MLPERIAGSYNKARNEKTTATEKEGTTMTDNKNMEGKKYTTSEELLAAIKGRNMAVSDDEMATASGGSGNDQPPNKYKVGDKVALWNNSTPGEIVEVFGYFDNVWTYRVRLDETGEVFFVAEIMMRPR